MITQISKDNISLFEHLIPGDLIEDLLIRIDTFGLGCLRRDLDGVFDGYGALVFVKEFDENGMVENIRIKWLYVDSNRRDDSIGCELITDLFWEFGNSDVPTMTVDVPAKEEYEDLGNFLSDWHFQFAPTYSLEFELELSALKDNKYFKSIKKDTEIKGAKSLAEADAGSLKAFLRELRKKCVKSGQYIDPMLTDYKYDYFDPKLSSVVIKNGSIEGALLVHVRPSGRLEIVVFDTLESNEQAYLAHLMYKSYQAALNSNIENGRIYHETYNEKGMNLIDNIFGTHEAPLVLRGIIENNRLGISTEQWEDMKEEYWKENPDLYEYLKNR